jgi:hypothetical protein
MIRRAIDNQAHIRDRRWETATLIIPFKGAPRAPIDHMHIRRSIQPGGADREEYHIA